MERDFNLSKPPSRGHRGLKSRLDSRKGRTRSAINAPGEKHSRKKKTSKSSHAREETDNNATLEERLFRKVKDGRRKPRNEQNLIQKFKKSPPDGNPSASQDLKIYEIEKRYRALLPAIKSAIMEHANFSKNSLNDVISINRPTECRGPMANNSNTQKRRYVEPFKQSNNIAEVDDASESYSSRCLIKDYSKQASKKPQMNPKSFGKRTNHVSKRIVGDCAPKGNDHSLPSIRGHQPYKRESSKYRLSIPRKKPNGDREVVGDDSKRTFQSKEIDSSKCINHIENKEILGSRQLDLHEINDEETLHERRLVDCEYHPSPKVAVEQNRLCTGPNSYESPSAHSNDSPSTGTPPAEKQTSKPTSNLDENKKCKCTDNLDQKPCICKCYCREQVSQDTYTYSVPSSSIEEFPEINQKAVQVQTSFPSSVGPCSPDTCPKRRVPTIVENRETEMQTEDADIEWQYEKNVVQPQRNMLSTFKIPSKRTAEMDDRLLRRIMFFNAHQNSVCNKNTPFCTYTVVHPTRTMSKGAGKDTCPDCPVSNKCNLALKNGPYHLTCNEVVVEVNALELSQEGVDSLAKVCSFVYIDYVFLGHVGNETALAPVSNNILFDSRKSYSVSMRFNRKERSILREQLNPSGLLVKDSIMFIIVCQAAPELGINKNWDFGFGHLSMKQMRERMGLEDAISLEVEMQKIRGTKNIGKLLVTFEGLSLIRTVMCEELNCVEPQLDSVIKKLNFNKKRVKVTDILEKEGKKVKIVKNRTKLQNDSG